MSSSLALALGCAAQTGEGTASTEPVGAEPTVFVEVPPEPSTQPEPPPAEPQPDDGSREQAKRLFQDAVRFYEAGDYANAVAKFEEAYRVAPMPALLFNIARGREQLGDVAGACGAYRAIDTDPASDDKLRATAATERGRLNCP